MSNSFIWLLDKTLLGATTQAQSGPGSYGNEGGAPHPPPNTRWGGADLTPSADMQPVALG